MATIHNPGDLVGNRYKVMDFIGEGGMQEVYRASDGLLGRVVALKAPKNASAKKRFQRSAVVSARINHPNVAKTLDYFETPTRAYLIEELIEGKDLGQVLAEFFEFVDPYLGAMVFHHLARGIAASHHADVIHRDLKPNNVMVIGGKYFKGVKITDFGIAKMAQEEIDEAIEKGDQKSFESSKTALGAIPYMAPEVIKGYPQKASDVWALGAIMYELISGKTPFGSGYRAILDIAKATPPAEPKLIKTRAQFRPLGKALFEIILACLQKDPADRPPADEIVSRCEKLCYSLEPREFGNISTYAHTNYGFITTGKEKDVFFHRDSFYLNGTPAVGDELFFARYKGGGNDRGFPFLAVRKPSSRNDR